MNTNLELATRYKVARRTINAVVNEVSYKRVNKEKI